MGMHQLWARRRCLSGCVQHHMQHLEKFFLFFQPFWCLQESQLLVRAWKLGWARAGDSVEVAALPLALGMGTQGLSSFKSPGN